MLNKGLARGFYLSVVFAVGLWCVGCAPSKDVIQSAIDSKIESWMASDPGFYSEVTGTISEYECSGDSCSVFVDVEYKVIKSGQCQKGAFCIGKYKRGETKHSKILMSLKKVGGKWLYEKHSFQ